MYSCWLILLAFFGGFGLLFAIGRSVSRNKIRKGAEAFIRLHPDAARLYIRPRGANQATLDIPRANGQAPTRFIEKKEKGVLLAPGVEYELNLLCEVSLPKDSSRKSVHTGIVIITAAPYMSYTLEFDETAKSFSLARDVDE